MAQDSGAAQYDDPIAQWWPAYLGKQATEELACTGAADCIGPEHNPTPGGLTLCCFAVLSVNFPLQPLP